MTRYIFLYGTLRHLPLLEIVLGRPADQINARPAEVADHVVSRVADHDFPMISAAPGEVANGLLLYGLSEEDVARMDYYEGGFGYTLRDLPVTVAGQSRPARVYFPDPGLWTPAEPWDLNAWASDHGRFVCALADEKMQSRPFMPVSGDLPAHVEMMMRQRASARLAAAARPGTQGRDLAEDVILHSRTRRYAGFFAYDELELQFRRYDGSMTDVLNRGYLAHAEAVVILIYDPARDQVLTVEQFRAPLYGAGDPSPWVWEAVAGLIDPGETPEQAARRETMEEAGVELDALHRIGPAYSSTGSTSEYLHFFVGTADLSHYGGGGVEAEGEDIRVGVQGFDEVMDWADAGHCKDGPLLLSLLWLARHRERLRAG